MTVQTLVTADDLACLSDGERYELVRGELRHMSPVGRPHGKFATRLARHLDVFVEAHDLGEVHVETGFYLEQSPDTVRAPDVAFISKERLATQSEEGFFTVAPDLAVEIVSPGETADEVQEKVELYLAHGARLVWVLYPHRKMVVVQRADGTAQRLRAGDTLDGEDVLPGFRLALAELFKA